MDKQNMIYTHSGILCSHTKEWSTDTCYTVDESWKHYTKGQEANTKDTCCVVLFMWYKWQIQRQKADKSLSGPGGKKERAIA